MKTLASHSRRGAALPLALYLMVIFGLIMAGILMVSMRGYQAMAARGAYEQSLYAAESGLNAMLGEIAEAIESGTNPPTHITGDLGGGLGSYDVVITSDYTNPGATGAQVVDPDPEPEYAWYWLKSTGSMGSASRTVNVKLVGSPFQDNPWNHVYYTDSTFASSYPGSGIPGRGNYRPAYASFSGSNQVMPCSKADPHGPACGNWMPEPLWNDMRNDAFKCQSSDTNANGVIDDAEIVKLTADSHKTLATADTHVYWKTGSTPPSDPASYNSSYTVKFCGVCAVVEHFEGIFFVHGNVTIGSYTDLDGMIVATGNITGEGAAQRTVGVAGKYQVYNPDDSSPYKRTPVLVAGGDFTLSSNDMTFLGAVWAGDTVDIRSASVFGSIVTPKAYFRGLGDGRGAKEYPYDLQYGFAEPIGWYNSKNSKFPIYPDYINPDTGTFDESVFYFPGRYKMPYFTESPSSSDSLHYEIGTYWEE